MSLYDKNFKYTEEAEVLSNKTSELLLPIFKEFVEKGHNPREIARIIMQETNTLELESILNKEIK